MERHSPIIILLQCFFESYRDYKNLSWLCSLHFLSNRKMKMKSQVFFIKKKEITSLLCKEPHPCVTLILRPFQLIYRCKVKFVF